MPQLAVVVGLMLLAEPAALPGDYPEASGAALDEESLRWLSAPELRIIRNEIFARHGHAFNSADLQAHFGRFEWYKPTGKVGAGVLSDLESANIKLLKRLESAAKKRTDVPSLFPIQNGGSWGFIDARGAVKVEPTFDDAGEFCEGRAAVKVGNMWGYVDSSGKLVIAATFEGAKRFREGLAPVAAGGKWGFIDRAGKTVVAPTFISAAAPSEGLAAVMTERGWGYVNRKGRRVIEPGYDQARKYSEGLACVSSFSRHQSKWGVIDRGGKVVIPMKQSECSGFSEGVAAIRIESTKAVYVDPKGAHTDLHREATHTTPAKAVSFSGGIGAVASHLESDDMGEHHFQWFIISRQGELIQELGCSYTEMKVDVVAGPGPGTYSIPTCDEVRSIRDGWVRVVADRDTSFLDRNGQQIFALSNLWADDFRGPLARIREAVSGKGVGYVNRKGKIVYAVRR